LSSQKITNLGSQLSVYAKNQEELRLSEHETLKPHVTTVEDRLIKEIQKTRSLHDAALRRSVDNFDRGHLELRSVVGANASSISSHVKDLQSSMRTLRQQLEH